MPYFFNFVNPAKINNAKAKNTISVPVLTLFHEKRSAKANFTNINPSKNIRLLRYNICHI